MFCLPSGDGVVSAGDTRCKWYFCQWFCLVQDGCEFFCCSRCAIVKVRHVGCFVGIYRFAYLPLVNHEIPLLRHNRLVVAFEQRKLVSCKVLCFGVRLRSIFDHIAVLLKAFNSTNFYFVTYGYSHRFAGQYCVIFDVSVVRVFDKVGNFKWVVFDFVESVNQSGNFVRMFHRNVGTKHDICGWCVGINHCNHPG